MYFQGYQGMPGDNGFPGPKGVAGRVLFPPNIASKGEKGEKGFHGLNGLPGQPGLQGEYGDRGLTGPLGMKVGGETNKNIEKMWTCELFFVWLSITIALLEI